MNTSKFLVANLVAVALAAQLGGCGDPVQSADLGNSHKIGAESSAGYMTGGSGGLLNFGIGRDKPGGDAGSGLGVNAYLWRGSLETLKFMPLASEDPFGGVIITDWWNPPSSPDERFKATAYILGRQLRSDAIRISVFRQVLQSGHWVDAPIDAGKQTDLENMVLTKARELRAQSASAQ
jgi:hypothetical protein